MTLIQRQTLIVRVLERIYLRQWQNPGRRSKAVRLLAEFNARRMVFAGYTTGEALASFRQCIEVARVNVAFEFSFAPLHANKEGGAS